MYRPDVVIVDPVYFILSGDSDNNRSKFIHEFEKVTQIVKKYGATLVAIDHTNKSASSGEFEFRAPRLTDMNGTGRSSFARSWILTKRRSSYQHGKPHELYLSLGGSCLGVHGGRDYAVDIDETPDADEHDRGVRHYEVTMFEPLAKWQKEAKEAREIEKYESERDEQNEIKRKIQQNLWDAQKEVGDDFKGLTQSKATDGVGADRTSKKVKRAWEALTLPTGPVEESESQGKYVRFRLKHEVFAQGRPEDYEISLDVEGDIEFESITLGEVVRL